MTMPAHFLRRGAIATAAALLLGLAIAQTMPRGPATTAQVLIVMITSWIVGYGAGWTVRSPWAMVLTPLVYMLAIEVGRFSIVGPTVDGLRLDEYGQLQRTVAQGLSFGTHPQTSRCFLG